MTLTIFIDTNAQYGPKKPPGREHQDYQHSRAVKELALRLGTQAATEDPMVDFTALMDAGFPGQVGMESIAP